MKTEAIAAWIRIVLSAHEIGGARPERVRADYPAIADAFAEEAVAHPLFTGDGAEWRTAALEIAVAGKESGFDRVATNFEGGGQFGLFQVHESNAKLLGLKTAWELFDIRVNTRAGVYLMHRSFDFCIARKREQSWWLGPFTSGRESCEWGIDASKERMGRGEWIFTHFAMADEG